MSPKKDFKVKTWSRDQIGSDMMCTQSLARGALLLDVGRLIANLKINIADFEKGPR